MKRYALLLSLAACGFSFSAKAQIVGPDYLNYLKAPVDVGLIMNSDFTSRAAIGAAWGGNTLYGTGYLGFNIAKDGTIYDPWTFLGNGGHNGGGLIWGDVEGNMTIGLKPSLGGADGTLLDNYIKGMSVVRFLVNGKVIIGTDLIVNSNYPGDYKLYVQQGIMTERLKVAVKSTADWSDYVFKPDYKLRTLPQLKAFITSNGHLPDVPSAEDVVKEGVDVGQMNATLLRKVEELTLYVLDLQEQIEKLKKASTPERN